MSFKVAYDFANNELVGLVVRLCRSWLSHGISDPVFQWGKFKRDLEVYKKVK